MCHALHIFLFNDAFRGTISCVRYLVHLPVAVLGKCAEYCLVRVPPCSLARVTLCELMFSSSDLLLLLCMLCCPSSVVPSLPCGFWYACQPDLLLHLLDDSVRPGCATGDQCVSVTIAAAETCETALQQSLVGCSLCGDSSSS
jgi:hypothetical protein